MKLEDTIYHQLSEGDPYLQFLERCHEPLESRYKRLEPQRLAEEKRLEEAWTRAHDPVAGILGLIGIFAGLGLGLWLLVALVKAI